MVTPNLGDITALESETTSTAVVDDSQGALVKAYRRARNDRTLRRESDVMGLTVAVALLAALSAGDDLSPHSKLDVLAVVWGTTIGLALTHWFALLLAARLVTDPDVRFSPLELLVSQTAMAAVVAVSATVSVVILSSDFDRFGARITAALFIGALVAVETRRSGWPASRIVLLSGGAIVIGVSVAAAKWFIGR